MSPPTTSVSSIHSLSSFLSYLFHRRSLLLHLVAFVVLLRLAIVVDFTAVYLCLAALYAIFVNVSHSSTAATAANQPHISAYSAFNTGGARMAGSISLDSWEGSYRPPGTAASTDTNGAQRAVGALAGVKPHPKRTSKAANQPCVCGSGKKYKNCCTPDRESERAAMDKDSEWLDD